ncbi:hypothetical protein CC86DRAFT_392426 [Ophiobolus disseminans]|uniref:Xylanolytic transcriptional activator regulatory domain-containing protein n=1 Tax=Ophiobolus disseminans TaxID=1469910 RepID=A0A6A7A7W4_9PLEO|nr:hypothetical protein CC86DRAFT_392426 [Ophiobolus disseminans]
MLNPHMAEDITILEQYLTGQSPDTQPAGRAYNTISTTSANPIVYLRVPRIRKGLRSSLDPGRTQREIVEQVLSPFAVEVRKLYFDYVQPCFPILDEQTFLQLWLKDNDRISPTLLCDIYATATLYWRQSEVLRKYPQPDLHFLWNTAVTALQEDFMEPTISTVLAALLDMMGRPVGTMTGNIVNTGRVVTLAQSLGLHRDPTSWNSSTHEKNMRVRLWWGVLIHDAWSSIGHGTPPTINSRYYDVPMVTPEMLATPEMSETYFRTTMTFIHLCKLTVILIDILPYVYSLTLDVDEMWRQLRRTECALDDWVLCLPEHLEASASITYVNGASNLWLTYLSVKLLACRLAFKVTLKEPVQSLEARQYRLSTLREASCEVATFVTSLRDAQLQGFWLPYTSYLLVTAATILLRCTVECGNIATKRSCATKLTAFRDRLRSASEESAWDLADFCLERCNEPIQRITDAMMVAPPNAQTPMADTSDGSAPIEMTQESNEALPTGNMFPPIDSLEFPWDSLCDTFDGPWPTQL